MIGFSAACERNKAHILGQLTAYFAGATRVLELGSGTGQHAVYFAARLPHLHWQPSERAQGLASLSARVRAEAGVNVLPPLELDVGDEGWPPGGYDAVFTANTLHIMGRREVERTFAGVARALVGPGILAVYGPFRRHGRTAPSNDRFDLELRARDPSSGLRDLDDLEDLGERHGLRLAADIALPANNQLLIWRRAGAPG